MRCVAIALVAGAACASPQPVTAEPTPPRRDPAPRPAEAPSRPARPSQPAPPPRDAAPALPATAQGLLDAHNRYRARHCAAPLTWSPKLAAAAEAWATSLAKRGCKFEHSNGATGENLAAGTSGALDAGSVTAMWYDEVAQYRFPDGGFAMNTGHFTQLVWRGTTQLGCAVTTCKGLDIWVCEYDPAGNVERGYRDNVLPTTCAKK